MRQGAVRCAEAAPADALVALKAYDHVATGTGKDLRRRLGVAHLHQTGRRDVSATKDLVTSNDDKVILSLYRWIYYGVHKIVIDWNGLQISVRILAFVEGISLSICQTRIECLTIMALIVIVSDKIWKANYGFLNLTAKMLTYHG